MFPIEAPGLVVDTTAGEVLLFLVLVTRDADSPEYTGVDIVEVGVIDPALRPLLLLLLF